MAFHCRILVTFLYLGNVSLKNVEKYVGLLTVEKDELWGVGSPGGGELITSSSASTGHSGQPLCPVPGVLPFLGSAQGGM